MIVANGFQLNKAKDLDWIIDTGGSDMLGQIKVKVGIKFDVNELRARRCWDLALASAIEYSWYSLVRYVLRVLRGILTYSYLALAPEAPRVHTYFRPLFKLQLQVFLTLNCSTIGQILV